MSETRERQAVTHCHVDGCPPEAGMSYTGFTIEAAAIAFARYRWHLEDLMSTSIDQERMLVIVCERDGVQFRLEVERSVTYTCKNLRGNADTP